MDRKLPVMVIIVLRGCASAAQALALGLQAPHERETGKPCRHANAILARIRRLG